MYSTDPGKDASGFGGEHGTGGSDTTGRDSGGAVRRWPGHGVYDPYVY